MYEEKLILLYIWHDGKSVHQWPGRPGFNLR